MITTVLNKNTYALQKEILAAFAVILFGCTLLEPISKSAFAVKVFVAAWFLKRICT